MFVKLFIKLLNLRIKGGTYKQTLLVGYILLLQALLHLLFQLLFFKAQPFLAPFLAKLQTKCQYALCACFLPIVLLLLTAFRILYYCIIQPLFKVCLLALYKA